MQLSVLFNFRKHYGEASAEALTIPVNGALSGQQPAWWAELSEGFTRSLLRKGRRPNTPRAYGSELRDFGRWLDTHQVHSLMDLGRLEIQAWQDDLRTRKQPRTQQVASSAVRGLLKWAADEELPTSSPGLWLRIEQQRAPRLKPRPIPLRDLKIIHNYFAAPTPPGTEIQILEHLRTRALFEVIFSSGARISEALQLTRASVGDNVIPVVQKGGDIHELVIGDEARAAAADYVAARPDKRPQLFIGYDLRYWLEPLSQKGVQASWDHLCRTLGIPRFTSHRIRHSCATEMIRNHVNVAIVARHMGHRDLASIQGYAEIDLDERLEAVQGLQRRLSEPVQMAMAGVL